MGAHRVSRHAVVGAVGIDGDARKFRFALAHRLADRHALRADCAAERAVFDVAAREDAAVFTLECRANLEAGIGRVSVLGRPDREVEKFMSSGRGAVRFSSSPVTGWSK